VLDFYGRLSKVSAQARRRRIPYWLDRLGMGKWARTRISRYSKGMMQRVGLAQALLHEPELIVLDEPTDGVDPLGRREIREIMLELKQAGRTIFINSHILSELELVCDRVAILVSGRVARQGSVRELTSHSAGYELTAVGSLEAHRGALEQLGAVVEGQSARIKGQDETAVNRLIDFLRSRGVLIQSLRPQRLTLEDVFVDVAQDATAKRA
jgi:ABC-2 type transport system ATP-binding protein